MADHDLCFMSQTIDEQIIKKPKIFPTNSTDLTLLLPDHLLRSIFSNLTSKDLMHVGLVSKNWHRNIPSHFTFNFHHSLFFRKRSRLDSLGELHQKYIYWVHSCFETYKSELSKAEKRILCIQFYDRDVNDTLKLIDGNNFHEVYLRFREGWHHLLYMLTLFHLTPLRPFWSTYFIHGEGKLVSLQELKLDRVRLTGETLSMFMSKCPSY